MNHEQTPQQTLAESPEVPPGLTDEQIQELRVWAFEELRSHIFALSALLDQQTALGARARRLEDYMATVEALLMDQADQECLRNLWQCYQQEQDAEIQDRRQGQRRSADRRGEND